MSLELVDLTIEDTDENDDDDDCILLGSEDEIPKNRLTDFAEIPSKDNGLSTLDENRPCSPTESLDSRDELYSLLDMTDPPNINEFVESEYEEAVQLVEVEYSDSDVTEIEAQDVSTDCILVHRRLYQCSFCIFNTDVEEWFHNHIQSHDPGRPHKQRVYCPDCTYSTGGLKFLFFHMRKIHAIYEPLFYRIGEKKYKCNYCCRSTELRIDIETHVNKHLSEPKKRPREFRFRYQCIYQQCRFSSEQMKEISRHIKKSHNLAFPKGYRERHNRESRYYYHCFKCSFMAPYVKMLNDHVLKHYSKRQLMQPCKYFCPSSSCKFESTKEYRIVRHLKLKHSFGRAFYRIGSALFKCFSCGVRKDNTHDMEEHCKKHQKKKQIISVIPC